MDGWMGENANPNRRPADSVTNLISSFSLSR